MANKGPNTNLSQFFITYSKQPHLDGKYTIFAKCVVYLHCFANILHSHTDLNRVIDGMDTLDAIEALEVDHKNRPVNPVKIQSVTIHANPIAV
jgi:peptidyl-prolyl cis-trans isomerase-like 3